MVDYSKWDGMDSSQEEEESGEEESGSGSESGEEEPKPKQPKKDQASSKGPDPVAADAKKSEGNEAYKAKNYDKAIHLYTEAIALHDQNHVYFSNRAACYAGKKNWESSKRDAMAVLRLNKTFMKGYVHLAKAYLNLGQIKQCQQCIMVALRQCKGQDTTAIKKVMQQMQAKAREESTSAPQRPPSPPQPQRRPPAPAADPEPGEDATGEEKAAWLKAKGNEHYKKAEYSAALSYYGQAIQEAPDVSTYYGNRAACYLMLNRYHEAAADCERGLRVDPGAVKLRTRQSTALLHQGDVEGAEQCLKDGLSEEVGSKLSSAEKSTLQEQWDAVKQVKQQWARGDAAVEMEKWSVALACFGKVESGGVSSSQKLHLGLAKCCAEMGDYPKCGSITQSVIAKDRGCIPAYLLRADALYYMGSEDQALKHLQAALRMDPDHTSCARRYKALKRILSEKTRLTAGIKDAIRGRKFEDALGMCDEMLALDKKDKGIMAKMNVKKAEAYSKMAVVLARTVEGEEELDKTWKACLKCACTAIYHDEKMIPAYLHKVKAMQSLGQFEEALEEMTVLSKGIGRGNESVHEHLKHAKFELKKSKRKDYYKLLNCKSASMATDKDIKIGYKKAAMKWHPDRHSNGTDEDKTEAERMFKEVGEAYEVLSDSQMRRLYDQGYDLEEIKQRTEMQNQRQHRGGGFGGFGGHGGFPF